MPTAKEIIIRLINEKVINGEEAYVLLNAILQSELMEAWKVLEESKNNKKNDLDWTPLTSPFTSPYTTTIGVATSSTSTGPTLLSSNSSTLTCDTLDSLTTASI